MKRADEIEVVKVDRSAMNSASVIMSITQSQRAMHKLLSTCLRHHDLNVAQWTLLSVLANGPQTPIAAAKALDIKASYISLLSRQLRKLGNFVSETSIKHDTRSKTLELTLEGRLFFKDIEAKLQVCIQRELASKIAPKDLATYFNVSDHIAKNVKHHADKTTSL